MGLASKLVFRIMVPATALVGCLGWFNYVSARDSAIHNARHELQINAELTKILADQAVKRLDRISEGLLRQKDLSDYLMFQLGGLASRAEEFRLELEARAQGLAESLPELVLLEIYDSEGERIVALEDGVRKLKPRRLYVQEWWPETYAKGSTLIKMDDGRLRYSRHHDGETTATCSLVVNPYGVFGPSFNHVVMDLPDASVELVDREHNVLFKRGPTLGDDTYAVSSSLGTMPMKVVMHRLESEIVAPAVASAWQIVQLLLVVEVVLILAIWFGLRTSVLKPLRKLMNLISALSKEEKLPQPLPATDNELAVLDQTIRQTARAEAKSRTKLRDLNANLESRVKERTSELLLVRDQALEASRAKSEFLANMSHEIRTPMNGVIGMTDLLKDTELNPEQRHSVDIIRSSGELLLGIINDILDFSKIEAGCIELEELPFDLSSAVADVAEVLAEKVQSKHLEMILDIDPETPVEVLGDPVRLRQVLTNLVGNAVKFTQEGEIRLVVKQLVRTKSMSRLMMRVEDTGIGIEPDACKKIFESFAQADNSTTRKYGGTGLGLTISRRLVELMGGELKLESEVGVGTSFYFTIDCEIPASSRNTKRRTYDDFKGVSVLVVDDNATNRAILSSQLMRWGMNVTLAHDGPNAMEKLVRKRQAGEMFQIALVDYQMPMMNGVELVKKLERYTRSDGMRIAMLTSMALRSCEEKEIRGLLDYKLTKPVRSEHLMAAIADMLGTGCADEAEVLEDQPEVDFSGVRVLLAEDNRVNQVVARRMLQKVGVTVFIAENGAEAVEQVSAMDFDLILMDCQMPEMDGYEASRELRRRGVTLPIVAMTANALSGDRQLCLDAGMDDYITKPVKQGKLQRILGKWVKRRRPAA